MLVKSRLITVADLLKAVLGLLGLQRWEGGGVHVGGRLHTAAGMGGRRRCGLLLLLLQRFLLDAHRSGDGGGNPIRDSCTATATWPAAGTGAAAPTDREGGRGGGGGGGGAG